MKRKILFTEIIILSLIIISCGKVKKEYEKAKQTNTIQSYEEFIQQYPNNNYTKKARVKLDSLHNDKIKKDYEKAKQSNTIQSYEEFIQQYPNDNYTEKARAKLDSLHYEIVASKDSIKTYEEFISEHPNSSFNNKVTERIEELHFKDAKSMNIIESYKKFLTKFPKSKFASGAKDKLKQLEEVAHKKIIEITAPEAVRELWKSWKGRYVIFVHRDRPVLHFSDFEGRMLYCAWINTERIIDDVSKLKDVGKIEFEIGILNNPDLYSDLFLESRDAIGIMIPDIADYYNFREKPKLIEVVIK